MRHLFLSGLFSIFLFTNTFYSQTGLKNGDLIFIINPEGQGKAIQLATGSDFTHVGIVFFEEGRPFVYHAIEPVSKNSLEEFISMSRDGKYHLRRLKDQELLTPSKIAAMKNEASALLGIHYDYSFSWSDHELYCSEYVWKLYHRHLGLELGQPRPMKTYRIGDPIVKQALEQRYGKKVPLEEKMISPGDLYNSKLLN